MNISIKDVDQCVKEITITVPAEQAMKDYRSVLQQFKNYVVVPGFRKGKAPLSMVDNLFFDQARESYLKEKVYDYYEAAIKGNDIKPMYQGVPTSLDWDKDKDLIMVFRYEIEPQVKITKYTGLEIPFNETEFNEEMIDEAIDNIRKNMGKEENIEGPIEKGDNLHITLESQDYASELDPSLTEINVVKLEDNSYGEKFNKDLIGHNINDTVNTIIKKDDNDFNVKVKINTIVRTVFPDINEEFAKNADFESLAEMRQDVEKNLRKQIETTNRREKQNSLLLKLIETNPFDIPPTSVISYSHKLAEPYARLLNKKPEDLANYYTQTAFFEIKSYYIVTELMKFVSLEITEENEKETVTELADELNLSVEEYLEKNPDVTKREEFVNRIKEKKLFDYLIENNIFIKKEDGVDETDDSDNRNEEENVKTEVEE